MGKNFWEVQEGIIGEILRIKAQTYHEFNGLLLLRLLVCLILASGYKHSHLFGQADS